MLKRNGLSRNHHPAAVRKLQPRRMRLQMPSEQTQKSPRDYKVVSMFVQLETIGAYDSVGLQQHEKVLNRTI